MCVSYSFRPSDHNISQYITIIPVMNINRWSTGGLWPLWVPLWPWGLAWCKTSRCYLRCWKRLPTAGDPRGIRLGFDRKDLEMPSWAQLRSLALATSLPGWRRFHAKSLLKHVDVDNWMYWIYMDIPCILNYIYIYQYIYLILNNIDGSWLSWFTI